jgi:hypothetical protein
MRKIATLLAVLAAMLVMTGVAEAKPRTYELSGTWTLEDVNGSPTIIPRIEDDVVEVRCKRRDQVEDYTVSNQEFVSWEGVTTDGRAVQVQPDFQEFGQSLTLTVTCRRG